MSQLTEKRWRSVMLPAPLVDEVEKRVNKKGSSFTGISDYITFALRKDLEGDKHWLPLSNPNYADKAMSRYSR